MSQPAEETHSEPDAVIVVSDHHANLAGRVATLLGAGARVYVVGEGVSIRPSSMSTLLLSGFKPSEEWGDSVLVSPTLRPADEPILASLVGPVAVRAFAGVAATVEATAQDIGTKHRTIVQDATPMAEWASAMSTTQSLNVQVKVTLPVRPMVHPIRLDSASRVAIDREVPLDVAVVGDCDSGTLLRLASRNQTDVARFPVVLAGSGHPRDQAAVVRTARMGVLDQVSRSSGMIVPAAAFRSELDRACVAVDAIWRGIPVQADEARRMGGYIGPATIEALEETEGSFRTLLGRDQAAVRLLRALDVDLYDEGSIAPSPARLTPRPPSISVILATMRPHLVPRALDFIRDQSYPEFDVVVAVHGEHDVDALTDLWGEFDSIAPKVVRVEAAETLGMVYNRGIAESEGELITIWDDDDYYGRHHLWDLAISMRRSRADLVGKGAEFFYLEGLNMTIQRSPYGRYRPSEFIGGSNLTMNRRLINEMGGFAPMSLGVDRELIGRIRSAGGTTYRDHGYGYLVHRRPVGHTWDPGEAYFLDSSIRQWSGLELDQTGITKDWG